MARRSSIDERTRLLNEAADLQEELAGFEDVFLSKGGDVGARKRRTVRPPRSRFAFAPDAELRREIARMRKELAGLEGVMLKKKPL